MSYEPGSLYYYKPSLPAALTLAIIFLLLALAHTYRTLHSRSLFTSPIILCCIELVIGFVIRALSSFNHNYASVGLFIGEEICFQLAPPVLALALYLTLGRTLYYVPYLSPIHPGRVRTTFVGLDIVVGALMGSGAARFGNTDMTEEQRMVGATLVKAGMVLQCVLILGFLTLCAVFCWRCVAYGNRVWRKVRGVMWCLCVCAGCILVRTAFRTAEFFQGYLGPLYTKEAYFYCLDILWVMLGVIIYLIFFPGALLPKSPKMYLAMDGETEREGPGWDDQRHWLITLLDPFDLVGVVRGRDKKTRFWEQEQDVHGSVSGESHVNVEVPAGWKGV